MAGVMTLGLTGCNNMTQFKKDDFEPDITTEAQEDTKARDQSEDITTEVTTEAITESETEVTTEVSTETETESLVGGHLESGGSADKSWLETESGCEFHVPDGFEVVNGMDGGFQFTLENKSLDMSIDMMEYWHSSRNEELTATPTLFADENIQSIYSDSGEGYCVDSGYYGENHDRVYYYKKTALSKDNGYISEIDFHYGLAHKQECDQVVTDFLNDFDYAVYDTYDVDLTPDTSQMQDGWKKAYLEEMSNEPQGEKKRSYSVPATSAYLYDMDGDGTPELFAFQGVDGGYEMEPHTYSYKDGKLIKMDTVANNSSTIYIYGEYIIAFGSYYGTDRNLLIHQFTGSDMYEIADIYFYGSLDAYGNPEIKSYSAGISNYDDLEKVLAKCGTRLQVTGDEHSADRNIYSIDLDTSKLSEMPGYKIFNQMEISRVIEEY